MVCVPGKFKLTNPPLAIAIVQLQTAATNALGPFNDDALHRVKECLSSLQVPLKNYDPKHEQNYTFTGPDSPPAVKQRTVHCFYSETKSEGVALTDDSVAFFVGAGYPGYAEFRTRFSGLIDCVAINNGTTSFKRIGIRYVNFLPSGSVNPIHDSLAGVRREGLLEEFAHFHHKYEFWCQTTNGRLHIQCASQHASRKPENLGHAEEVFPDDRLGSYDDTAYHLDIFENAKLPEPLSKVDALSHLDKMHDRVDQAFLSSVSDEGLASWGPETIA